MGVCLPGGRLIGALLDDDKRYQVLTLSTF
jgi:hypothetical protein